MLDIRRRFLGSESCFKAIKKECATPPHIHDPPNRYVTGHDQFTKPSPTLVLQATNTVGRRPGYEGNGDLRDLCEMCMRLSSHLQGSCPAPG